MNAAIIGKSRINSEIKLMLEQEGYIPSIIEDMSDIRKIEGEIGNFIIKTKAGDLSSLFVIAVKDMEPQAAKAGEGFLDMPVTLLTGTDSIESISKGREPVVFLLDYPYESSSDMTELALACAIRLVNRRRKVIYASRFLRTSGSNMERLYKQARQTGVVFFRYKDVQLLYDNENAAFHLNLSDESSCLNIDTNSIVVPPVNDPDSDCEAWEKALKLRQDAICNNNNPSFFMYPALTNRKGIYSIRVKPDKTATLGWKDQLRFILGDIAASLPVSSISSSIEDGGLSIAVKTECDAREPANCPDVLTSHAEKSICHAVIDASKCAFCYTCYRACPHSAMAPDVENSVMKNLENACNACGICVAICPAKAVEITGNSRIDGGDKQKREEAAVEADLVGGTSMRMEENNPLLTILCCENSGAIAVEKLRSRCSTLLDRVLIRQVSCSGEISTQLIASALEESGSILVAVCADGACRHFDGNKRARKAVEHAKEMLTASGLDASRVSYVGLSHAMTGVLKDWITEIKKCSTDTAAEKFNYREGRS